MPDFSQYLSFEDFKKSIESSDKNNDLVSEQSDNFRKFLEQLIQEKGSNSLKIAFSDTHYTNFSTAWNRFVENPHDNEFKYGIAPIANHLLQAAFFNATYFTQETPATEENIKAKYETLINNINHGHLSDDSMFSDSHYCFECGKKFVLKMKDWSSEFKFIDRSTGKRMVVDAPACIEEKIITHPIEFSGTKLLVADWFRIPEFTEALDTHYKYDINCSAGKVEETLYYLNEFNVIKISVSNSSPDIFAQNGNFAAGVADADSSTQVLKDSGKVGQVCTDLWAVTMVEYNQLVNIVAKTQGHEKALQTVNDYLEKNDVLQLEVEASTYNLKFAPDYYRFSTLIKKDDTQMVLGEEIYPYFTLEKTLPEKTKKLKM